MNNLLILMRRILTSAQESGEDMVSGVFSAGSMRDCTNNPLTIQHGLGKVPSAIYVVKTAGIETSSTDGVISNISYINLEGYEIKRFCRTSSKSSREAVWSTLMTSDSSSFTIQQNILNGKYLWYAI